MNLASVKSSCEQDHFAYFKEIFKTFEFGVFPPWYKK